jgi:A-factor type gamma-butyrolactone 1'-reductase (1S-forming)
MGVAIVMRFEGKVAFVTGATSGIGRATAVEFAREGADVVIAARREQQGAEVVEEIEALGRRALYVPTDVAKTEDCRAMVERALERFGRLDAAVNNAGIGRSGHDVVVEEEEVWDNVISVNLKGVFLCMKYEVPALLKSGGGAIVNTSSVGGLKGRAGSSAYCSSKAGVHAVTKCAALEFAAQGVRVNAICPGVVSTEMLDRWIARVPEVAKELTVNQPMGRIADAREIARAILFLASDDASFMTGQLMAVDGGVYI